MHILYNVFSLQTDMGNVFQHDERVVPEDGVQDLFNAIAGTVRTLANSKRKFFLVIVLSSDEALFIEYKTCNCSLLHDPDSAKTLGTITSKHSAPSLQRLAPNEQQHMI